MRRQVKFVVLSVFLDPLYNPENSVIIIKLKDFSEEHLRAAGIKKRYYNDDQKRCLDEIIEDIRYGKF